LLDLADCNLGHYRNSADLEQGLHMIAIPTPYVCGLKPSDGEPLPLGPSHVWELEPAGSAGMIEYSGQGVKDIREEMSEKKRQMAALGARVLEDASASPETATAIRLRHGAEQATVRTVAESLEQALTLVAQWLGWWQGLEATPADVKVTVSLNKEFFALKATPEEVKAALLALQAGEISYETFYERLKQGGWARDGVTAEQERQQIEAEGRKVDPNADPNADPEVDSKENTQ
jgi:hypothetical protein